MDTEWLEDVCNVLVSKGFSSKSRGMVKEVADFVQEVDRDQGNKKWERLLSADNGDQAKHSIRSSTYKKRQRLADQIVRSVAILPSDTLFESNLLRAETLVRHLQILARLLRSNGRLNSAKKTLIRASELCKRFQSTTLHVNVIQELIDIAALQFEKSEMSQLRVTLQDLVRLRSFEDEARMLEAEVRLTVHLYASDPVKYGAFVRGAIDRMREIDQEATTFQIRLTRYRIELYTYSLLGDPHSMLQVSTIATSWLEDNPDAYARTYMGEFLGSRMSAALMLNDFDSAKSTWESIQHTTEPGSANWSGILQLYFLVCTSSGNLEEARNVVTTYKSIKGIKGPTWRGQLWEVYHAFIVLLIQHDVIPAGSLEGEKRIYVKNLEKRCAEVIKDKPQVNVLILILQVFQWLSASNYSKIIDSAENLRVYASRYLKNRQTQRTGLFLRKLCTLPASDFDPDVAQSRAIALHNNYPEADKLLRDDAEVVPYDTLWSLVLKILRENARSGNRAR